MSRSVRLIRLLLSSTLLWLGACATPPGTQSVPWDEIEDGPPLESVDLSAVQEPIPRREPRSRSGNPDSYRELGGEYFVLESEAGYRERGIASWYGRKFHGRRTSSGEPYDMLAMTAAHRTLPLPSFVRVTHLDSGKQVVVRVNDRGPFHDDRVIDLSYAAASRIGIVDSGTGPVEVVALTPWLDAKPASQPPSSPPLRPMAKAPTTPEKPAAIAAANGPPYYIEAGHYETRQQAAERAAELRSVAVAPSVDVIIRGSYLIRLGPFDELEQANRLRRHLIALKYRGVSITP
jgi:rare lipoprotein A